MPALPPHLPPAPSAIVRPRSARPSGAVRVVQIGALPPTSRGKATAPTAVQGVLPLGSPGGQLPLGAIAPHTFKSDRNRLARAYSDREVREIAHKICAGIIEVIYGNRGPSQLVLCTSERVYDDLARRSAQEKARLRSLDTPTPPLRLERLRVQRPAARAVEVCARITRGTRTQAIAARIEFKDGRWTCVAFETDKT